MKKIITVLVLFLLALVPLTLAVDPEEAEPIFCMDGETQCDGFYTQECRNGNWWLPELVVDSCGVECLENSDCDSGSVCVAVRCVVIPVNDTPVITPPTVVQPSRNKNHWVRDCDFNRKDECKLRIKIHGINKVATIKDESNDYTLTFDSLTRGMMKYKRFIPWMTKDPVITIKEGTKTIFNEVVEEGKIIFNNIRITDIEHRGVFLWLTLEMEE